MKFLLTERFASVSESVFWYFNKFPWCYQVVPNLDVSSRKYQIIISIISITSIDKKLCSQRFFCYKVSSLGVPFESMEKAKLSTRGCCRIWQPLEPILVGKCATLHGKIWNFPEMCMRNTLLYIDSIWSAEID
jgi:hypothetical protein